MSPGGVKHEHLSSRVRFQPGADLGIEAIDLGQKVSQVLFHHLPSFRQNLSQSDRNAFRAGSYEAGRKPDVRVVIIRRTTMNDLEVRILGSEFVDPGSLEREIRVPHRDVELRPREPGQLADTRFVGRWIGSRRDHNGNRHPIPGNLFDEVGLRQNRYRDHRAIGSFCSSATPRNRYQSE